MLAAFHMTFLGTQPTFTQVPPRRSGLDDRSLGAVLGRALRAGEAAAAAADADEIEDIAGHSELHHDTRTQCRMIYPLRRRPSCGMVSGRHRPRGAAALLEF